MEHPTRGSNVIHDDISHLHQQPRHDDVGNRYLEDIAAFEFCKK